LVAFAIKRERKRVQAALLVEEQIKYNLLSVGFAYFSTHMVLFENGKLDSLAAEALANYGVGHKIHQ